MVITKKTKDGLSTIVATLLIILLTLVAVCIIWFVVKNVVEGGIPQITINETICSPPRNTTLLEGDYPIPANDNLVVRIESPILNFSNVRQDGSGDCGNIDLKSAIMNADNLENLKKIINSSLSFNASKVYFTKDKGMIKNDNGCPVLIDFYYLSNLQFQEVCEQQEVKDNIINWCYSKDDCGQVQIDDTLKLEPNWMDENCEKLQCNANNYLDCISYKCGNYTIKRLS